jgi:signal peptidase I
MVLIGILSVARGIFLLMPRVQVRSVYLKIVLLACLGVAAWYFLKPDVMQHIPLYVKSAVLTALAIGVLFMVPGGILSEEQKKTMLEYMDSVIIAGVTALLLIWYVVRSFYIPSESMLGTLKVNDMILVNELVYRIYEPKRGDIVVFHPPERANSEGKDYIKRVVAVGGETVEIKGDDVYVDGVKLVEPYKYIDERALLSGGGETLKVQVPPDDVFVMGDNRNNSEDSRRWGTLPKKDIIGKAFVIFYPPTRMRLLH